MNPVKTGIYSKPIKYYPLETQETKKRFGKLFRKEVKPQEPEILLPPLFELIPEGKCRNCGTDISSKYCPECGQKAGTQRFTFKTCLHNIFTALLNFDNSSIRTFRTLFTHPGQLMQEYICGRRISYMNPFTLLILLCTFYGIYYGILNLVFDFPPPKELPPATTFPEKLQRQLQLASDSLLIRTILMLPVYAYFTKRLLKQLIRNSVNYTEIVFMTAYISCQKLLVDLLFLPIIEVYPKPAFKFLYYGAYLFLTCWALKGFFKISWWKAAWKSTLIYFYSWFVLGMLIVLFLLGGLAGFIFLRLGYEMTIGFFEYSFMAGLIFFIFFILLPPYLIFRKRIRRLVQRAREKLKRDITKEK